ncbi:MAG TPA: TonB family protein [Thermodesulfovibrionales bacterium]|nr:TonB family protein [Thermodesulfovibrionales bacterium]
MKFHILGGIDSTAPRWKLPLAFSLIVHLLVLVVIFFSPPSKKEPPKSFVTRLITPEEMRGEAPAPRPAEPRRQASLSPRRSPVVPRAVPSQRAIPRSPERESPVASLPPSVHMPERALEGAPEQVSPGQGIPFGNKAPVGGIPSSPGGGVTTPSTPSLRERLFDPEVMAKLAKREEKRQNSGITFDTNEFKYEGYMMKLKSRIEGIWRYPQDAARRGLYGDLYIRFTIKKNGKLEDVELVRTSGNKSLDDAAMRALKDGEPYWPLPDEWGKDALTVTGHFVYSMYGTYIR